MDGEDKNLGIAYILAVIMPMFSLHRHYLGKHGSAILQMLLWFVGIGAIWFFVDLITMRSLVNEANMSIGAYDKVNIYIKDDGFHYVTNRTRKIENKKETNESKENKILKIAKKYNGRITVTQVALETDLSLEEAEKMLKDLVRKGYVNMNVNDNGVIIYEFYELT